MFRTIKSFKNKKQRTRHDQTSPFSSTSTFLKENSCFLCSASSKVNNGIDWKDLRRGLKITTTLLLRLLLEELDISLEESLVAVMLTPSHQSGFK
ncbi:unnamed protein product [Microthlaspi erraticum]|uniref:Uncharacterized protein n=1 Tax=Microthlaspi erraticum TaxID=1685480 RepID=A0A6D2IPB5_9BRAS|nr:unnamed protein product [Microthlaspi erraticum]CAA7030258.1 unnamed protein product [Microthlaspi erraticum]